MIKIENNSDILGEELWITSQYRDFKLLRCVCVGIEDVAYSTLINVFFYDTKKINKIELHHVNNCGHMYDVNDDSLNIFSDKKEAHEESVKQIKLKISRLDAICRDIQGTLDEMK